MVGNVKFVWNIPNALSIFRLLLLPVFVVLILAVEKDADIPIWSFAVLVLSGVTDSLDGIIARRFHQITDFGKLMDPIADKVTQVTVVICLAVRYTVLIPLVVVCLLKELIQAVGGYILLRRGEKIQGAKWFGKVSTFVFYGAMALIVLLPDMPDWVRIGLVCLVAALMLFSFIKYMIIFLHLRRELPPKERPASPKT